MCIILCVRDTVYMSSSLYETDYIYHLFMCYAVAQFVEALRYKPEGRGFDFRWGLFLIDNHSGHTVALGSTQPRTEMSTRDLLWG